MGFKLAQQTLTYAAGGVSGKIVVFLTVPLYLHYLTPSEYGFIGIAVATTTGAKVLGVIGGSERTRYPLLCCKRTKRATGSS